MKTVKILKQTGNAAIDIALDTINIKKQAFIFVNSKRSAEKTAEDLSKELKVSSRKLDELSESILKVLARPTKQCERLARCVRKGIAFHHAGLTQKQKEMIEDSFRHGLIKIICCTPTLSFGIDSPAFRAIIKDLRRYGHHGLAYIPVLEYMQMAGRCVSGDTIIFTEKGRPVKISEIASRYFKKYETGRKEVKNLQVLAADLKAFRPQISNVNYIWKRKVDSIIEIETKSGKVIRVSEDHPLLVFTKIYSGKARISKVFDSRRELYKKAMQLRRIYKWGENRISRCLGVFEKRHMIKHWLTGKIKPKENAFVWKRANQLRKSENYKNTDYLALLVDFQQFDQPVPLRVFLPYEKIVQLNKNEFMTKQGHTKCGFPKEWSEELCRFIAKIMADGSIYYNKKDNSYTIRYFNKNKKIQDEYKQICFRLFRKKVSTRWRRGSYEAGFKSYLVGRFLENIGVPPGKKSFILRVPEPIFTLPKKLIKSFFMEYVRCDGWETEGSYTVITSSKELAYGFALLLSKIGYVARVHKKKPNNWRKKCIWETSVTKSQFIDGKRKGCVGNIHPDLIKSIKKLSEKQYVYDLTLEKGHNFVANSLIIHNSGRPKYDKSGEAICISRSEAEKEEIYEMYILGEPEEIFSKLAVEPVLRTYLLSLIATNFVNSKKQILEFFSKTFWAYQFKDMKRLGRIITRMLKLLERFGFIVVKDRIKATMIGKRVAELYIDPLTADQLIRCLKKQKTHPFSLLQMVSYTLEMRPLLSVRAKEYDEVQEKLLKFQSSLAVQEPSMFEPDYEEFLNSVKTAFFFYDWINEKDEEFLLERYTIRPGEIKVKLDIANWLLYASEELARMLQMQKIIKDVVKLRLRIKYGVKEELLPLLKLKNIGRVRARKLFANGIRDIGDIIKIDITALVQILGKNIALDVKKQVGQDFDKLKVKERKRKGQISLLDY